MQTLTFSFHEALYNFPLLFHYLYIESDITKISGNQNFFEKSISMLLQEYPFTHTIETSMSLRLTRAPLRSTEICILISLVHHMTCITVVIYVATRPTLNSSAARANSPTVDYPSMLHPITVITTIPPRLRTLSPILSEMHEWCIVTDAPEGGCK